MNREVHARFWERPEVKFLRATRPFLPFAPFINSTAVGGEADMPLCSG